MNQALKG